MIEIVVFISCGAEVAALRDVAARVLRALERSFLNGLDISVVVRNWDYRDEPPEVVASGEFAARSLMMVGRASVVIGILGATVPPITAEELLEAIRRFSSGEADNVLLFVDRATKGRAHSRFLRKIEEETGMAVVYQTFEGDIDLQEKLFVALIPYLVRKTLLERQTLIPIATREAS